METHIKLIAVLHIALGLFGLLAVFVVFMVFGGTATMVAVTAPPAEAVTAFSVLGIVGMFIMGIVFICSLPGIIGGIGLLQNQNWGRVIILIVSLFNLFNFPFGSVLAIYSFLVLLSSESHPIFNRPSSPPPVPHA